MHDHTPIIGFSGSFAAIASGMISTLETLDTWFRVGTSFFGLIVGALTLVYMMRKLRKQ